jgi:hypothetical protein
MHLVRHHPECSFQGPKWQRVSGPILKSSMMLVRIQRVDLSYTLVFLRSLFSTPSSWIRLRLSMWGVDDYLTWSLCRLLFFLGSLLLYLYLLEGRASVKRMQPVLTHLKGVVVLPVHSLILEVTSDCPRKPKCYYFAAKSSSVGIY